MDETTTSPAVVTSTAADKHLNETVKPAVAEVTSALQNNKATAQTANTTPATTASATAPSTTPGQPLNTYSYVGNDGTSKTIQAATPQEAMTKAPDIAAHSGVQLMQNQPTTTETPTETPTEATTPTTPAESEDQKALKQAQKEYQTQAKSVQDTIAQISSGAIPLNPGQQAQVAGLQQSYAALIESQKLTNIGASGVANIRGYQKGAAEYDPMFQVKTIGSIVAKGNQLVADLNTKMAAAVGQLTEAFKSNNIATVKEQWGIYQDAAKERTDALQKTIEDTQAAIKAAQDAQQKEMDKVNDIAKSAAESGADQATLAKILNSGSVAEAVFNAGDSLQKGTGTVGEYLFYKKEALAKGQIPMSFNDYATMDANRKRSIVNVNSGGLSGQEQNKFLSITNKYQADSVINAAIKANQVNAVADQIIANPSSATNQLAALYLYVKNLDPDSAVREGELGLAGKTQSYLQTYSNSITRLSKGQVLAPAAATELAKATKSLVKTWEDTADKKTKLYQSQAQNTSPAVGNSFKLYIQDYTDSSNDPIAREDEAKQTVISYGASNPAAQQAIKDLAGVVQPDLGRAYTWEEIAQIVGAQ